ncbi:MAG: hypothetical protein D6820_08150 [Lentisphaerae bacterium]|nr:MAG: hypothetical protein D6820_08150 [Lentisphaerota bacterium]
MFHGSVKSAWVYSLVCCGFVLGLSGCSQSRKGGGSSTMVIGQQAHTAVYGTGAQGKLEFVIVTDLPSDGTKVSMSISSFPLSVFSGWKGSIRTPSGKTIQFKANNNHLEIDGARYPFNKGRLFLLSGNSGKISVEQLNVPIGNSPREVELEQVAKRDEVQRFFGGDGGTR